MVLVVGLPNASALPWLAASLLIHIGYYVTLVGAYRHGELGFAYPIMRGTAPLLVALAERPAARRAPAADGLARRRGHLRRRAPDRPDPLGARRPARAATRSRFALANAVIIAVYTIVDGLGVRASGNALQYVALLFLLDGMPYFAIVLWQRRAALRAGVRLHARQRWPVALLGAVRLARLLRHRALGDDARAGGLGRRAARDLGPVRGADRRLLLKERFRLQRAVGTGAIIAGVMALRLA